MRRLLFVLATLAPAAPAWAQTCTDRSVDPEAQVSLCDQAFQAAATPEDASLALA